MVIKSKTYFKADQYRNMHEILKGINAAHKHIMERGMAEDKSEPDEEMKKKILTKCIHESLNRHIH